MSSVDNNGVFTFATVNINHTLPLQLYYTLIYTVIITGNSEYSV